ncbi:MAG: NAD(P)/FAD-dependent oxidoreductase [Lachnospiraceae bacterium]|nr:NAD(P)/FAD-dependent oxidoreductase [Lachnospiraceae bacterium]
MRQYDIAVVGGGAAGMMAAIVAAENGADVVILEHMDTIGKKILMTGNGKCNYTNRKQGIEWYYGDNPAFVLPVFEQFGFDKTIDFMRKLGIWPKEKNGYFYPASEQAAAVLEVLQMELRRLNVKICCNIGIRKIIPDEDGFTFETKTENYRSRKCLIATGGKAAKKTGSDGSGFLYLEALGHHIIDVVPALVALQAEQSYFKDIAGIRADAMVRLYVDGTVKTEESGEVQLTDYGISGIPVFQLSRIAAKALLNGQKVTAGIDFARELTFHELEVVLKMRCRSGKKTAEEFLVGMYPKKLIPVLLSLAEIEPLTLADQIPDAKITALAEVIKEFPVTVTGTKKFDYAQTTAGGVDTSEINNESLESKLVPGLYFAGEVIDIDGKCGGYNLQWAWSSGYVAGLHAAMALSGEETC